MAGSLAIAFAVPAPPSIFRQGGALAPGPAGALPAAIASIATGLVLENIVRLAFGNEPRGYDRPIARDIKLGEIRVSPQQLETMALALALMLAVFAALPSRESARRCAPRPTIPSWRRSKASGPSAGRHDGELFGMGLVGVGGMLLGLDSSIDPLTGTRILLSIFAAAVLGGLGSALAPRWAPS